MIPNQKHLFNIPDNITYLNCAYMSPQLKSVSQIGKENLVQKETPWKIEPADFFESIDELKSLFAQIINAKSDHIAIIPAVSYGVATAAQNVNLSKDSNIVVLAEQFPSNIYAWQELAKIKDTSIITVEKPGDKDWTTAILNSINSNTKVVALPQVHWTDGGFIDLFQIRIKCDEIDSALIVDATQSVGAHMFDVNKIRPDFLICSAYKWLLGPYSLSYLYVDKKYHDGKPLEHSWVNRKGSQNFANLVKYTNKLESGACRFDVGEKGNFIHLPMAIEALKQILEWGVENIYESLTHLTKYAEEKALECGLEITPIAKRSGHLMGLNFKSGVPEKLIRNLKDENIYVSIRGNSIRIAPYLYNDKSDIDRLFETIKLY